MENNTLFMYTRVPTSFISVLLSLFVFIGWTAWLCLRWIRSLRTPSIWVPVTAKITTIHDVVRSGRWAPPRLLPIGFPRSYAVYSAEYVVDGRVYSIRAIGSPETQLGEQVPLVYLECNPSEWRKRSDQSPGRETFWEIKAILGFVLVTGIVLFGSVTVALHERGYSWDEALHWYRAFAF